MSIIWQMQTAYICSKLSLVIIEFGGDHVVVNDAFGNVFQIPNELIDGWIFQTIGL